MVVFSARNVSGAGGTCRVRVNEPYGVFAEILAQQSVERISASPDHLVFMRHPALSRGHHADDERSQFFVRRLQSGYVEAVWPAPRGADLEEYESCRTMVHVHFPNTRPRDRHPSDQTTV